MATKSLWNRFVASFLILLATTISLPGQIGRGSITGIANDPTGAAMPGVSVVATNVETGTNLRQSRTPPGLTPSQHCRPANIRSDSKRPDSRNSSARTSPSKRAP